MNFPFRYGINSLLLNSEGTRLRDAEFILGVEPRAEDATAQAWFRLNCDAEDAAHDFCRNRAGIVEVWGARGTRSSAIFDLDEDGDLDIVTNEFNARPLVLISNLTERNPAVRYLKLRLIGKTSNRNGLGTRVAVRTDAGSQVQWMDGKSGYLSQSVLPLYFGLGTSNRVEEVHVTWPDGKAQTVTSPAINTVIEVSEQ